MHAEKLIACLAPNCQKLIAVGDRRIHTDRSLLGKIQFEEIPTLHHLENIQPIIWSAFVWISRLIWGLLRTSWIVFINRKKVDVVVCFLGVYYTPILLIGRILGKKLVSFEPSGGITHVKYKYQGWMGSKLVTQLLISLRSMNRQLADVIGIESMSEIDQGELEHWAEKVRVVNLYVDTMYYHPFKSLSERPYQVGYIGRLEIAKGIEEFITAAALLNGKNITFSIVGNGSLQSVVETRLMHASMHHIKFFGWADSPQVVSHLNNLRLLVLPSAAEGLPNVILEAMACKTPVLATPVGSIPELIQHKITGYLLPDCSPETIASAIEQALNDEDLPHIAHRALVHVEKKYSLESSTLQWQVVLDELIH